MAATFVRVEFKPGTAAFGSDEPGTVLLGETELVPVVRPELVAKIASDGSASGALLPLLFEPIPLAA